jgi:TPR repeat protein
MRPMWARILVGVVASVLVQASADAGCLGVASAPAANIDYATEISLLGPLADQGIASAQVMLGTLYSNGWGVAKDYTKAAAWFRRAATQEDACGETQLGVLYQSGNGVAKNYATAMNWYQKAASLGDESAQALLGDIYFDGLGVRQDYAAAAGWYQKAANGGDPDSQFKLGLMYQRGQGLAQDNIQAHVWFDLSAGQIGHPFAAADARATVEAMMSPDQVAQAVRLAQEWKPHRATDPQPGLAVDAQQASP